MKWIPISLIILIGQSAWIPTKHITIGEAKTYDQALQQATASEIDQITDDSEQSRQQTHRQKIQGKVSWYGESEGEITGEVHTVTAYTLSEDETDSTPCQTALGEKVNICELSGSIQLCATRSYPLLSILQVGTATCIVADRTSKKYADRIDIVAPTTDVAMTFGKRYLPVSVIGYVEEVEQAKDMPSLRENIFERAGKK